MKTSVEISSAIAKEVKRILSAEGGTLRGLIEEGLRKVIEDRSKQRGKPFVLRDASVSGQGLSDEFKGASWDQIRDAIYKTS